MDWAKGMLKQFDEYQQSHPWLGFPYAVAKKYGDDQAGNQAALITYYGFLSLFPLLLVAATVLGIVLAHSPNLQHQILNWALANFPYLAPSCTTTSTPSRAPAWAWRSAWPARSMAPVASPRRRISVQPFVASP